MSNGINDPKAMFFIWVEDNPIIIDFIEVSASQKHPKNISYEQHRASIHAQIHQKLTAFSNKYHNLLREPRKTHLPRHLPKYKDMRKIYHSTKFLEDKVIRKIHKIREHALVAVNTMIIMYQTKGLIPENMIVTVHFKNLDQKFDEKTPKLRALENKYLYFLAQFRKILPKAGIEQLQLRLKNIIELTLPSYKEELFFFNPTRLQLNFEYLMYHPNLGLANKLEELIENFNALSPDMFTQEILSIMEILTKKFHINDQRHVSIIIGYLFRMLYDEVYTRVPEFWDLQLNYDNINPLRHLTIADIDPPRDYLPHFYEDKPAGEQFRSNEHFYAAIEILEIIGFFTNPLDILRGMHYALIEIEKSASYYAVDKSTISMLPFEVTFGLLVGTSLGSQIPELPKLSKFVNNYCPKSGMASALEFAKAKLIALNMHFNNLMQKKQKSKPDQ